MTNNINQLGVIPWGAIVSGVVSIFSTIMDRNGRRVSPDEQYQKAGVWGAMLTEISVDSSMTGDQLASKWKDILPFRKPKTKDNFVNNQLRGKSRDQIIDHLVEKVNDEMRKGGFPELTKEQMYANLASSGGVILPQESDIVPGGSPYSGNGNYGSSQRFNQNFPSSGQFNYGFNPNGQNQRIDPYSTDPRQRIQQSQFSTNASIGSMGVLLLFSVALGGYFFLNKNEKSKNNSKNLWNNR